MSAENTTGELVLLRYTEQQDVTVVVVPAHTSGFVRAFGGPAVGAYVEILDTECTPIRPRLNVPEVGAVTVRIDPDSASAVQTQLPNPPALVFDQVALCGSSRGLDEIPSEP